MFCENCGAEIRDGSRFCPSCGTPVAEPETKPGGEPPPPRRGWWQRLAALAGRSRRERLLAAGTAAAALVAVVAFILLDTPDDAPSQDAFTRAADGQCVAAKRLVAAAGRVAATDPKPGAQERFAGSVLEAVADWRAAYVGLEPTPGHATAAASLDDAMLGLIIELGGLARQTRQGSPRDVARQAAATDEASVALEAAISDLGLRRCSQLTLTPVGSG